VTEIPDPRVDALGYKACCAALYESEAIRYLLGDAMRPGGLALTQEILKAASVAPGMRLLDVACGSGDCRTAVEELGASFYGIDLGLRNLTRASGGSVAVAEAERLPFGDAAFDAILVQCAFCTFPDKAAVLSEFARVLKLGGLLLLADVTLDCQTLAPELSSVFAAAACLADARPRREYEAFAQTGGLRVIRSEDRPDAARGFLRGIDQKLLLVRIAQAVKAIDLWDMDIAEARRLLKLGLGMVDRGELSYGYLVAEKPTSLA
jgi:SAM-dependent methyltransferase